MAKTVESIKQELVDEIIKNLEGGELPWNKGWISYNSMPHNAVTKNRYSGTNVLYLAIAARKNNFDDSRWCTFNQAKAQGWNVKKGSVGTGITFWMQYDTKTKKAFDHRTISHLPLDQQKQYREKKCNICF